MPAHRLTADQLAQTHAILADVRQKLHLAAAGDALTLFSMRRKVQKELMHDERGKPAHRNEIKRLKRLEQDNKCMLCGELLPDKYAVLDRLDAVLGYTFENTRLIHADCDQAVQASRGYA